jgi:hypothetical protein
MEKGIKNSLFGNLIIIAVDFDLILFEVIAIKSKFSPSTY